MHFIDVNFLYIIPIMLFLGSFFIYSYNLEDQPWHGDEVNYLGWAGNYIHLIKNGDFNNQCLQSIDNCNLLYHIPAHGATYSPIRMLLIGIPMGLQNYDSGDFYNWSCYYFRCFNPHEMPTLHQMAVGRLLSPLFGALTIVISFVIGKILFNRYVGIVASLLFLFYDIWMWYSRTIMTEVHYIFFSLLSLLLLVYSFKTEPPKIKYLILSAVAFGFALTSKLLSVEFSVLFIGVILIGSLFKRQAGIIVGKKHILKVFLSVFLFFTVAGLSFLLTEPGFYKNPLSQIAVMKSDMDNYNRDVWYIGYPTLHGIQIFRVISLFNYILFPSFLEYHVYEPDFKLNDNYGWLNPPTYSSIALTVFFFFGFGYLIQKIRKSKDYSSEIFLLIWFISTFIFSLLMAKDLHLERYLLPLMISDIFIASYGLWNFVKDISNNKAKIAFVIYFIFTHSVTTLIYWKEVYNSPHTIWTSPLPYGTLQESFFNPFGFVVNAIFSAFFILMVLIRLRKRIAFISTKSQRVK